MLSFSTQAQIKEGDKMPLFQLKDQNGVLINAADIVGKQPLVVYFYPKDDTPGCTKEACSFRDSYAEFEDAGARVIGISADDVQSHKAFAEKYRLNFTLLSDVDNEVRKQFGVPGDIFGLIPGRVTYVIDKQGIVRQVFNSQMNAEKHITESLKAIKNLK
jgi:peroxiredoxin Q/BCP